MPNIYEGGYNIQNPSANKALIKISPEVAKERFLELYMQTAHIHKTCQIIGLAPRCIYQWRHSDPIFLENMNIAEQVALGVLEDEATRRAVYGVERGVYQGGKLVGHVREYSDTLMIVLLKARAPHKYKERFSGELTGADGKPLVPEAKIVHVHSTVPLAQSEQDIVIETSPNNYELPPSPPSIKADIDDLLGDEDLLGDL